jgi:hypothetical protein
MRKAGARCPGCSDGDVASLLVYSSNSFTSLFFKAFLLY